MAYDILKGASGTPLIFFLVESADHITGLTAASPTVTISKNGGTFATPSGAVSEIANGWYKVAGNATDTGTAGPLALHATAASGDPCDIVVANIIDNTVATYGANLVDISGAAVSTSTAQLGVNVVTNGDKAGYSLTQTFPTNFSSLSIDLSGRIDLGKILGTASAGAAGYAALDWGHITAPTTVVDLSGTTIKNLDGNTVQTGDAFARLGAPVGLSTSADIAALKSDLDGGVTVAAVASAASNFKKNTAINNFGFVMTDSTTHAPKTALTVTAVRSLDGAAFASCANAVAEVSNGWYQINLAAADTNANRLALRFTAAGADDLNIEIITQP